MEGESAKANTKFTDNMMFIDGYSVKAGNIFWQ